MVWHFSGLLFLMVLSVSLGLFSRHGVSRSVNCTVPEGKGVLRGDRGCKVEVSGGRLEMFSKMPAGMQPLSK